MLVATPTSCISAPIALRWTSVIEASGSNTIEAQSYGPPCPSPPRNARDSAVAVVLTLIENEAVPTPVLGHSWKRMICARAVAPHPEG